MAIKVWIVECDSCGRLFDALKETFIEDTDGQQTCNNCNATENDECQSCRKLGTTNCANHYPQCFEK